MSRYTIAVYLRLSSEDEDLKQSGKPESNSIANQRNLLQSYISRVPEFAGADMMEFCDDGWSGKNFDRPAVQEMIGLVRQNKIQCIIVKDLSRFGRDYLIVGNYLSRVFPFLGVRFIAVNDGFDSSRQEDIDSLEVAFKSLIYDLYSRDLSRKVRTAKQFRAKRGDFLSPYAPYGYRKDPDNKNHLLIDPPAAETVRRIFSMMADGYTTDQIARTLNDEGVLTPMLYKRETDCSRTKWQSIGEENFWTGRQIARLLRDERYTGKNIYGKWMRDKVGHWHTIKVSRSDWITVEDTHDGIVTRKEFDRAQAAMRAFVERGSVCWEERALLRKVRCGICGHIMERANARSHPYYHCRTPRVTSAYPCSQDKIPEEDILEVLLDGLHMQAAAAVEMERIWAERHRLEKKDVSAMQKRLTALREANHKREQQSKELYEALAFGQISKTEYLTAKSALTKQKDSAAVQIAQLEAEIDNTNTNGRLQNDFVSIFQKYAEVQEITSEIAAEVLQEIRIYPGRQLEIIWNYCEEYKKMMLDLEEDSEGE